MSLRDELAGRPAEAPRPAPYRILAPAGWQRVPASALPEVFGELAVDRLKQAGRPDLVLQMRGMLSQLRRQMRSAHVFEAYLPPLIDGTPQPAVLTAAPFVRPVDVPWDAAVARAAGTAEVVEPEFTETFMWRWVKDAAGGPGGAGEPTIRTRAHHYVIPVAKDDAERRGLHFVHTVLATDEQVAPVSPAQVTPARLTEALLDTGDLILSTFRWSAATPCAAR